MKIMSLIASSTEIVCALGVGEQIVGRSHECDFPVWVKKLPVCTSPKFETGGNSAEIDQSVQKIVREGLSIYRVDVDLIRKLKPDVILTQDQCEVCAVSLKDVEAAVCELVESRPKVVSLKTNGLADFWRDIQRVADVLDVPTQGERLIVQLKGQMEKVSSGVLAKFRKKPESTQLRIACIEWIDPLMAAGNWVPELVEMAGGSNLFGEAGKHSTKMTWEELCEKNPDIIVAMPCGLDIVKTRGEMETLKNKPGWSGLKAVRDDQVYVTDGNQYFNRPGPRLVESLEILAELLNPGLFGFSHVGSGWENL